MQPVIVLKISLIIELGAEALQENVILNHKVFDRSLELHRFELGAEWCFTTFSWFLLA